MSPVLSPSSRTTFGRGFWRCGISSLRRPPTLRASVRLTETLKWGEPAYLTEATRSGSTIRLGWFRSSERECGVLFNCRTTLVDDFRERFPGVFAYEKNRAILLDAREPLPKAPLSTCLGMALTYHRRR